MDYLVIDGNAIGYTSQYANPLHVGETEVQAVFHSVKTLRELLERYEGYKPIVLWDGRAQWRFDMWPEYKSKRSTNPVSIAQKEKYKKVAPLIEKTFEALGVTQMRSASNEADDIAGWLAPQLARDGKVVLITKDEDWIQLVQKRVSWFDPYNNKRASVGNFKDQTGYDNADLFLQAKVLIGDGSDCIPGVEGIGEKCAPAFLEKYGSVPDFLSRFESKEFDGETEIPKGSDLSRYRKKIAKFATEDEGREVYERNMTLMDLRDKERPSDLVINKSEYNEAKLKTLFERLAFVSLLKKLDEFVEPFLSREVEL